MENLYWWSRYGDFSPGVGILPHMGEVIMPSVLAFRYGEVSICENPKS